jgi:hypothetical protein
MANRVNEIKKQIKYTQNLSLREHIATPQKVGILIIYTRERANFSNGSFENSPWCLDGNHTNVAI